MLLRLSFLASVLSIASCAHVEDGGGVKVDYTARFDPWRATNHALQPASTGDEDAQRAFFLATYVRVSQPVAGGEDLEQMSDNARKLLTALGDAPFAAALRAMRPEVRSSVRWFLQMSSIRSTAPQTHALLSAAPAIDWPVDRAIRGD